MNSKAKLMGHPVHPMLVHFPIAFYAATVIAYGAYAGTGNRFWFELGVIANIAGVVSAAAAAIPGFLDWATGIPSGHPAKATGLQHLALNVGALLLFAIDAGVQYAQWNDPSPTFAVALVLSGLGLALTLAAGALGATLVSRHHVGVDLTPEQERIDIVAAPHHSRASHPSAHR